MKKTPRYGAPPGTLLELSEAVKTRKCRLCRGDLPPKRRTAWCGDSCVWKWKLLKGDPGAIREEVNDRDQWICQICGTDTFIIHRIYRRFEDRNIGVSFMVLLGWSEYKAKRQIYWEADHIRPLVEGGTHDLSNLRCLCVPCHTNVTRDLARRRAKGR